MGGSARSAAGRPALFVVPHPDDETLAAGVTLAEHVIAGREVHILLLTRGEKSAARHVINGTAVSGWWGVRHDPAVEGYEPLDETAFGAARHRELLAAAGCLGIPAERIHEANLPNEGVTVANATQAIVATADAIGGDVGLWAPSHTVDDHPDHLAAGQAVQQLGVDDPVRWWDRRYYILPAYWSGDPRLPSVTYWWDTPADAAVAARARDACRAYGSWQPRAGVFACGYQSVPEMFAKIDVNPKCLVHK